MATSPHLRIIRQTAGTEPGPPEIPQTRVFPQLEGRPPCRPPDSETGAPPLPRTAPRSGQALVEFLVALVSILVVTAALLQVASLGRAHTDTMVNARREAAERAMSPLATLSDAEFIEDWEEGPDGSRYTRDDVRQDAFASGFQNQIVSRASPDDAGWDVYDALPGQPLTALRGSGNPSTLFGLTSGEAHETVELLPAVQHLLYAAESVDVESTVWMTRMEGLY